MNELTIYYEELQRHCLPTKRRTDYLCQCVEQQFSMKLHAIHANSIFIPQMWADEGMGPELIEMWGFP